MPNVPRGEAYRHLLRAQPRPEQPEPDDHRLRIYAAAERVHDARRALERARAINTEFRREIQALESLGQGLMLAMLRKANGE